MESKETLASTVILFLQAGEVKSGAKGEGRRGNAVEREGDGDSERGTFCFPAAPELRVAQPDKPPVFSSPSKPCVRQEGVADPISVCLGVLLIQQPHPHCFPLRATWFMPLN